MNNSKMYMLGKYKMQGMDYSSLVKKVAASTIEYNLVPVHPMNPPSRVMPYMDFQFVSPWIKNMNILLELLELKSKIHLIIYLI